MAMVVASSGALRRRPPRLAATGNRRHGSAGGQAGGDGQSTTQPAGRCRWRSRPRPGDDDLHGRHGLWFVPTGEVLPARPLVDQRLPRELRLQPGLHRRVELAGHVRLSASATAPRSSAPVDVVRRIDRDVRPLFTARPEGGRPGQRLPVRQRRLVRQPARRPVARRQDQPDLAVAPAAGGVRAARHGQGADGERRRRGRRHRQDATSRSTRSSARNSTSASSSPASAASSSAAIPTTSS